MDLQFGHYRLKRTERQVLGPQGPVELSARSFDILTLLLERPDEVIGKAELFDAVWPGLVVEENTLQVHVSALRKALDAGMIMTVHGRGYKYAGPRPVAKSDGSGPSDPASPAATGQPAQSRPSIAVLPFDNLSGDSGQQYISDGITEDITIELARFRGLTVASRLAAFHYGGKGKSPVEAARALGVAYVVEGSVRKSGSRLRITAQLIDAKTGSHVWADRYDRDLADVFAVQDEVVAAIVSMLEGRMAAAEAAIARAKPTASWSAYDYFLQGRELCNSNRELEAVPFLAKAVSIDSKFAVAHAWLATALLLSNLYANTAAPSLIAQADAAAGRALELDANDAASQWAKAMVLFYRGDNAGARPYFERALALNPADIQIQGDYANWQRSSGTPAKALATIDRLIAQGPFVPDWFATVRGLTLFDLKRYAEAVESFQSLPPHYIEAWLFLAAACAQIDDANGAEQALARLRELRPGLSLKDVARFKNYDDPELQEHFVEALRKAGLPE